MEKLITTLTTLAATSLILVGCATDDPHQRAKTGAAIGAIAGAVIGHQVDGDKGRYGGAVVGAAIGGTTGHYMDKQQRELEEKLAEEQRQHDIELTRISEDQLQVNLNSEVSFAYDSAKLNPAFYDTLDKLSAVISEYDKTSVHIIGHTDNTGSEEYNQILSERRAVSVSSWLSKNGVTTGRITTEGRGELQPRADNDTAAGRQLNRRVEIILKSTQ